MNKCSNQLTGKGNNKLTSHKSTNSEATAAWSNQQHQESKSKVSIPSQDSVTEAKKWVDNGSKL